MKSTFEDDLRLQGELIVSTLCFGELFEVSSSGSVDLNVLVASLLTKLLGTGVAVASGTRTFVTVKNGWAYGRSSVLRASFGVNYRLGFSSTFTSVELSALAFGLVILGRRTTEVLDFLAGNNGGFKLLGSFCSSSLRVNGSFGLCHFDNVALELFITSI